MNKYFRSYGFIALVLLLVTYFGLLWFTSFNRYFVGTVAMSVATFVIYGLDKSAAKMGTGRAPENFLHLLALLGGFPGGWAGMFIFWHKIRKPVFWAVLIFSTILHVALWFLLYQ